MGEICRSSSSGSISEEDEEDKSSEDLNEKEEIEETMDENLNENEIERGEELTSVGKLCIPKLSLPTEKESSRKLDKSKIEFQRTASEELTTLAQNLGETYMTQDLTALLSFLQNDTGVKARKKERISVSITSGENFSSLKHMPISQDKIDSLNSCYYKIKCAILKTFSKLTIHWKYFDVIANPINLLYSELISCHKEKFSTGDIEFRKLIYEVLLNYANHIDHVHCKWNHYTNEKFSLTRTKAFREKMDKFIWRIHNQLYSSIEQKLYEQVELQLTLLGEYMEYCSTGITSIQVSSVCMEYLLKVKYMIISKGSISPSKIEHIHLLYCLLKIFDQIILNNQNNYLREFLFSIFIEKKETWRFIKNFACQILKNINLEKAIINHHTEKLKKQTIINNNTRCCDEKLSPQTNNNNNNGNSPKGSSNDFPSSSSSSNDEFYKIIYLYKRQVLLHFQYCFQLIYDLIQFYNKKINKNKNKHNNSLFEENLNNKEDYLYNFDFLLDPNFGYILQILSEFKGTTTQSEYQKDILRFLISIFSIDNCIFLNNQSYVDAYVTYAYLSFIKLYHNLYTDEDTLELIHLHLQLLLAFAKNKNVKIVMKFYQLRIMDFLVREINLEYESTQFRSSSMKQPISNDDISESSTDNTTTSNFDSLHDTIIHSKSSNDENNNNQSSNDLEKSSINSSPPKQSIQSLSNDDINNSSSSTFDQVDNNNNFDSSNHPSSSSSSIITKKQTGARAFLHKYTKRKEKQKDDSSFDSISHIVSPPTKQRKTSSHIVFSPKGKSKWNVRNKKNASTLTRKNPPLPLVPIDDTLNQKKENSFPLSPCSKLSNSPKIKHHDSNEIEALDLDEKNLNLGDDIDDDDDQKLNNSLEEIIDTDDLDEDDTEEEEEDEEEESYETSSDENSSSFYDSEDDKKPKIPGLSLLSVPSKTSSGSKSPASFSLALPDNLIKGGTSSTNQGGNKPAALSLALPDNLIKGGTSSTNQSGSKPGSFDLSLPDNLIKGGNNNNNNTTTNHISHHHHHFEEDKIGNLSRLERKIDKNDPKCQLIFEQQKEKSNDDTTSVHHDIDIQQMNKIYLKERKERKIYATKDIQITTIQLIFQLLLTPFGTLEKLYTDQFPLNNKKLNIPFLLRYHLSHPENSNIIPQLISESKLMGRDIFRLLKLLCTQLFKKDDYNELHRLATGAYGTVYETTLKMTTTSSTDNNNNNNNHQEKSSTTHNNDVIITQSNQNDNNQTTSTNSTSDSVNNNINKSNSTTTTTSKQENINDKIPVAIKLMEISKSIHDRCVLHDIFDEILVLDKFKGDNRISHTFDFGCDEEFYWITMKKYKCSLKHWRIKQKASLQENLSLYLNIYMNVLNSFQFLIENKVNHFDVKCDNFLLQPLNENKNWNEDDENNFWYPSSDIPNFYICLADFGEAKVYDKEIDGYTTRNRGTEFTKSPEMLSVAYASQKTRATYDRRKKNGASSPSDIWSLGCLLYELLTGEFLFYDHDWVRFYIRVTQAQELFTPEKIEKIDNNQILIEFLRFVLNRDPVRRPSIYDVIQRFKYVRAQLTKVNSSNILRMPKDHGFNDPEINSSPSTPSSPSLHNNPSINHFPKQNQRCNSKNKTLQRQRRQKSNSSLQDSDDSSQSNQTPKQQQLLDPHTSSSDHFTLAHSISYDTLSVSSNGENEKITRPKIEYFSENISKITEYLYLGPIDEICKRSVLKNNHITHMINCTNNKNLYSDEFETLKIPLTKECFLLSQNSSGSGSGSGSSLFEENIGKFVSFINDARKKNGKVLIYCYDGSSCSASVAVAYFMISRNLSYFESMLFIKDCRYIIDIPSCFSKVLCHFQDKQKQKKQTFQCLCGACSLTVINSFDQSHFSNPFSCSCLLVNIIFFCLVLVY